MHTTDYAVTECVRRRPEARRDVLGSENANLGVENAVPGVEIQRLEVRRGAPGVENSVLGVERQRPEVRNLLLEVERETLEPERGMPEVGNGRLEVGQEDDLFIDNRIGMAASGSKDAAVPPKPGLHGTLPLPLREGAGPLREEAGDLCPLGVSRIQEAPGPGGVVSSISAPPARAVHGGLPIIGLEVGCGASLPSTQRD